MSRPNFRVVENYTDNVDFVELTKDYLNPKMSVNDICKKHDISRNKYYQFKERIVEETGVESKPSVLGGKLKGFNENVNIYKVELTGRYRIIKQINRKTYYFGDYESLEIAMDVRNSLMEHDWDFDYYFEEIKPKYNPTLPLETPMGFEEDFLKMTVAELREKYNLSEYQFYMISTPLKQRLGLVRKPRVKV